MAITWRLPGLVYAMTLKLPERTYRTRANQYPPYTGSILDFQDPRQAMGI